MSNEITIQEGEAKQIRPRLKKLIVRNFRGIGNKPVEIELDKIVVLVGPNNVGKSSILKAYQLAMSEGSGESELKLEDFPNGVVSETNVPEIELHTVVYDNLPGVRWINEEEGEKVIRERWRWYSPGKPIRQGFDAIEGDWAPKDVPWGAANIANSFRPRPHLVDAFQNPKEQAVEIIKLLSEVVKDKIKMVTEDSNVESDYQKLLSTISSLRKKVLEESTEHIQTMEQQISSLIGEVFPGYVVKFDPRSEEEIEQDINLFNKISNSQLLMGQGNGGHLSSIDRQGSGARRTLLWSALKMVAESNLAKKETIKGKTKKSSTKDNETEAAMSTLARPHVLLLDEPELCLHPNAVRDACRVLYDLPNSGNWQVMVTTHSPAFIDVSRDNTTIVRVEQTNGEISGTTVFRPNKVKLDDDDRSLLKLLNIFDPYIAEFFFGGRSIIVEGDTEYTALKYIISKNPSVYKDVHIIRARGKATIASLVKILNQFGSSYSVLHDSDTQTIMKKGKVTKNPAWTNNEKILAAINNHPGNAKVRLLASITNFEAAYFGEETKSEKPYNAISKLKESQEAFNKVEKLLQALLDHNVQPPVGAVEWNDINQLEEYVLAPGQTIQFVASTEESKNPL